MSIYIVTECAHDSVHRQFRSKLGNHNDERQTVVCSQARAIINRVFSYFAWLEKRSGRCGLLKRAPEAVGQWSWWIVALALMKPGFSESHKINKRCLPSSAVYNWYRRMVLIIVFLCWWRKKWHRRSVKIKQIEGCGLNGHQFKLHELESRECWTVCQSKSLVVFV